MAESNLSINAGDMHRMACDIKISAGPNGHLYGLTSPGIATYETISSGFHPPIGGNATTYLTDVGVAGSGVINFSDANVSQFVVGATLAAGGTGGTTGNQVVTVSGGTATEAATLNVTISGGAITSVNDVAFHGLYTALPSNPVTVTGAGLSGATVNLTWDTPPANVTNGILDLPLVTPPSIAGQLGYSSASFSAASYNSTTGLLTLTFASNPFTPILGNNVGNYATISGITGTGGGVSSLAGSFQVVGVSGGTVVLQAPLALTASALSGGTLAAQTASTVSSEGPYIQVQWNPNEPVSFTIRYRACKAGKTTT